MNQTTRDKLVYLRQWVGMRVTVVTAQDKQYTGVLTNIVFDSTRLMYLMLDDRICLNYDHVVEVRQEK
jgi:RNase P/RNase MRP subunit p29